MPTCRSISLKASPRDIQPSDRIVWNVHDECLPLHCGSLNDITEMSNMDSTACYDIYYNN